jgi:hypothetical protein
MLYAGKRIKQEVIMKHIALIVVLCLLAGMTYGTFELEDPAAQIYEQQQASLDRQVKQTLEKDTLCAINTDTYKCSCIHKETGRKISMTHNECVPRASKSPNNQKP